DAMKPRRPGGDVVNMFLTAVLPAFLYVIFGASQDYSTDMLPTGRGNVAMYIMVSMAAYGAVTATTGIGGMAAVERMQGWGRQLGLTPMRDSRYVLVKAQLGLTIALIPVALIYVIGFATGAAGELRAWLLSGVLVLAGAEIGRAHV